MSGGTFRFIVGDDDLDGLVRGEYLVTIWPAGARAELAYRSDHSATWGRFVTALRDHDEQDRLENEAGHELEEQAYEQWLANTQEDREAHRAWEGQQ